MRSAFVVPGTVLGRAEASRLPGTFAQSRFWRVTRRSNTPFDISELASRFTVASRSVDRSGCGVVSARQPRVTDCLARTCAVDALAIASSTLEGSLGIIAGRDDGASLSMPVQCGMAWKTREGGTQRFVRVLSDQAPIIPLVSANATMCDLFLVRVFSRMWSI